MIVAEYYVRQQKHIFVTAKANSFYLNQLKSEIKLRVLNNNQWRDYGIQLPLFFDEGEHSLLQKIFDSKGHFLLLNIHDLIFQEGHAYQDVHSLLQEIVSELNLVDEFKPWITDAGTMMVTALNEHNQHYEIRR